MNLLSAVLLNSNLNLSGLLRSFPKGITGSKPSISITVLGAQGLCPTSQAANVTSSQGKMLRQEVLLQETTISFWMWFTPATVLPSD